MPWQIPEAQVCKTQPLSSRGTHTCRVPRGHRGTGWRRRSFGTWGGRQGSWQVLINEWALTQLPPGWAAQGRAFARWKLIKKQDSGSKRAACSRNSPWSAFLKSFLSAFTGSGHSIWGQRARAEEDGRGGGERDGERRPQAPQ